LSSAAAQELTATITAAGSGAMATAGNIKQDGDAALTLSARSHWKRLDALDHSGQHL